MQLSNVRPVQHTDICGIHRLLQLEQERPNSSQISTEFGSYHSFRRLFNTQAWGGGGRQLIIRQYSPLTCWGFFPFFSTTSSSSRRSELLKAKQMVKSSSVRSKGWASQTGQVIARSAGSDHL